MEPHLKLWLEDDGRIVMSEYRLRLLRLVAESGSIARAARAMGLSYRRAWGKIKELETNLGVPLVCGAVGGAGGGHTALTDAGAELVRRYAAFHARVQAAMSEAYAETFGDVSAKETMNAKR